MGNSEHLDRAGILDEIIRLSRNHYKPNMCMMKIQYLQKLLKIIEVMEILSRLDGSHSLYPHGTPQPTRARHPGGHP
jgi:hypothetical protein